MSDLKLDNLIADIEFLMIGKINKYIIDLGKTSPSLSEEDKNEKTKSMAVLVRFGF